MSIGQRRRSTYFETQQILNSTEPIAYLNVRVCDIWALGSNDNDETIKSVELVMYR